MFNCFLGDGWIGCCLYIYEFMLDMGYVGYFGDLFGVVELVEFGIVIGMYEFVIVG